MQKESKRPLTCGSDPFPVFPGRYPFQSLKVPVKGADSGIAAGKSNVADAVLCMFKKINSIADPVPVYQVCKRLIQGMIQIS